MSIRLLLSCLLVIAALAFAGCGNKPVQLILASPDSSNTTDTERPQP